MPTAAIEAASEEFAVGAIGAGTGMSCFGLKGGIGSASRRLRLDGETLSSRCSGAGQFRPCRRSAFARWQAAGPNVAARRGGRLLHHRHWHRRSAGASPADARRASCGRRSGMVRLVLGQRQRRYRAGVHHCEQACRTTPNRICSNTACWPRRVSTGCSRLPRKGRRKQCSMHWSPRRPWWDDRDTVVSGSPRCCSLPAALSRQQEETMNATSGSPRSAARRLEPCGRWRRLARPGQRPAADRGSLVCGHRAAKDQSAS